MAISSKDLTDETAMAFSRAFLDGYLSPSLGAISKSETDQLVFRLLIDAGLLKPSDQAYDIARALNVTPTRARNLLFQWQLRSLSGPEELRREIAKSISNVRFATDGDHLTFGIESPLVREELRAQFKRIGIFPDASFSAEIVRVSVDHFVEFLDHYFDDDLKSQLTKALIADKQVKDTSFKAVVTDVLKALAQKAVGKAGDTVVEGALASVGPFIKALFAGSGADARKHAGQ